MVFFCDFVFFICVIYCSVFVIVVFMILGYLFMLIFGVVDMVVIGCLGDVVLLGGIVLGGIIFDLVFIMFNFLCVGIMGLIV